MLLMPRQQVHGMSPCVDNGLPRARDKVLESQCEPAGFQEYARGHHKVSKTKAREHSIQERGRIHRAESTQRHAPQSAQRSESYGFRAETATQQRSAFALQTGETEAPLEPRPGERGPEMGVERGAPPLGFRPQGVNIVSSSCLEN